MFMFDLSGLVCGLQAGEAGQVYRLGQVRSGGAAQRSTVARVLSGAVQAVVAVSHAHYGKTASAHKVSTSCTENVTY
jgi:hypothetical protein